MIYRWTPWMDKLATNLHDAERRLVRKRNEAVAVLCAPARDVDMRSRSSSPNTPSSDSSPSSSDIPLVLPAPPDDLGVKELEAAQLFNAFIDDSAFDSTTPIAPISTGVAHERLNSMLSSSYRIPPPVCLPVEHSTLTLSAPQIPIDQKPENAGLESENAGRVVTPPKENCINLPIRVRNVPFQGAKSRVETQLKVTIDLVWDPTVRSHFHHAPSVMACSNDVAPTVGSWEWISLPAGSATKRRGRKDAKIVPAPEQTLTLHTIVTVASPPHTAARACKKCLAREAKRAERKRRGPNDSEPSSLESSIGPEDDKIVLYNCADVLDFKSGTVDLPVRLTCYCRHHSEKTGFCITFILRDHTGRTVGTGITPPILITDDHKSTARKVQVQAQEPTTRKKNRMPKPYARSAQTSRASSIGLVKDEVGGYGTPSTQGYTSPVPQSPARFSNPFAMIGGGLGDAATLLSPPHSPIHTRPGSKLQSPIQTRGHSPVPESGEQEIGALMSDVLMGMGMDGILGGDPLLLGMDDASFLNAQFPTDTPMFDASNSSWETMPLNFSAPKIQPDASNWEPTPAWPEPEPIPRVSRVVPNSGPIQGGIEVTLLGENFTRAYECKFGDYVATETALWGSNTLVCLLPPAAQPGAVSVCIKGYEHASDVIFTYKDDSVDRSLMELALRVVGQRMTGRQEEPCNIARRIVAVGEMQPNSNVLTTRLAQSVIESNPTPREDEIIQFLTLLDVPTVGRVSIRSAVCLQNETGHTLLHLCAVLGYDSLAADLLGRGADPDVRDATGQTALHLAALREQVGCVKVLLEGGADVEVVNAYGLSPVDVATERGDAEVLALLEKSEAGPNLVDDSASVEADESDLEEEAPDGEDKALSTADDFFGERPSRPSLDDVRPGFLGDPAKVPSTWFHRTLSNLQPQKAWPLALPDMPALPTWPVTIPWPQTPEGGAFDLATFRGFLGTKQQSSQQQQHTYPPAAQPEGAAQGLNRAQLQTRLARRLGYYPTQVTDREVQAYSHHSQKMRKLKKDRMLVLFWLPILLIVIAWGLYQSVPVAVHAMMHRVKGLLPLAGN